MDFSVERRALVDKLIVKGIKHPGVLAAIGSVPRHCFVPNESLAQAYGDFPLPIGHGQTISQPFIVAHMTQLLLGEQQKLGRVLEIGTGSGYQAAVLAELVDELYTIELIPTLAQQAQQRLQKLEYHNIHYRCGDGKEGWAEHAPFDGIIVTAAPENIPVALLTQLANAARLVIPVGVTGQQELQVIARQGEHYHKSLIEWVSFVPLR